MKFSESWLREWVNPDITSDELVASLTMAGLEVDGTEAVAAAFDGVVVGEIEAVEAHPDADKLRVCRVSDGQESFQVVCGAANVRTGMKAPFARVGAVLGPDFTIKQAKLRGVESSGMLCAADELGLGEKSAGLLELPASAPTGQDIRSYLNLDRDTIIEVDLTPNRGDCLSIRGLARETAVLKRLAVQEPVISAVPASIDDKLDISLQAPEGCPRYLGRIIRNVNVAAETPVYMQEKLRRSGIRSIDPVVDVTNYVLLELGQPMHAFDLAKIEGSISVRKSRPKEKLTLLDGREIALSEGTLLICDEHKALAMAGVMGGEDSGVTTTTRDIFLESAFFDPLTVAGKAREYGMQTDAAHRFERGVDPVMPALAMERATALLLDIVGGEAGPVVEAFASLPATAPVRLRAARISSLLGVDLAAGDVEDILQRLGLELENKDAEGWTWRVPSWRFDISIEADLIEEIARIHGYDKLPVTEPQSRMSLKGSPERQLELRAIRRRLNAIGYQEVITYSFVDSGLQGKLSRPEEAPMVLSNPISRDMGEMRLNMWPGLLKTLKHNQNRQQTRVRIFESGLVFAKTASGILQQPKIGGLLWGDAMPEQWGTASRAADFYDLKGDIEALLQLNMDKGYSFHATEHPALQPGQTAALQHKGEQVGLLGALNPVLQRELDIPGKVFLFEIDLKALRQAMLPTYQPLSRHPSVRRDLALTVAASQNFGDIETLLRQTAGAELTEVVLFDVYVGENIEKGKKSLALGLTFQHPSRTLHDDEVNAIIDNCIKALEQQFNAVLR